MATICLQRKDAILFTIIRKPGRHGKSFFGEINGYSYTCPQYPELTAYTNYYDGVKDALWVVEYNGSYVLKQSNKYYRWIEYIPVVNFFYENILWHRKYDLYFNDECVGFCDRVNKGIHGRFRFVIDGQEYFNGIGYSLSKRPHVVNEWAIELADGEEVAIMKTEVDEYMYYITPLSDDLDERILVLMAMMTDAYHFTYDGENSFMMIYSFRKKQMLIRKRY